MEKKTSNINSSEVSVNKKKTEIKRTDFPLAKINFVLMMVCGVLIVAGFLLMLGGANDGTEFNDDIFGFRRVVVGPTMAFIGFVAMGVAIIFKKK
ncbi:MAG: DUF3098 domain-containing protein [Muribaculaceae bacterium]|nr:DUF3098 domain-containing protein [Muribaculaceae bacterium]